MILSTHPRYTRLTLFRSVKSDRLLEYNDLPGIELIGGEGVRYLVGRGGAVQS